MVSFGGTSVAPVIPKVHLLQHLLWASCTSLFHSFTWNSLRVMHTFTHYMFQPTERSQKIPDPQLHFPPHSFHHSLISLKYLDVGTDKTEMTSKSQESQYFSVPKSLLVPHHMAGSYMLRFLISVKHRDMGVEETHSKCFWNEWTNWKILRNNKQTWLKCWFHGTDYGGGFPSSPAVYSWSPGTLSPRSKHFNVND